MAISITSADTSHLSALLQAIRGARICVLYQTPNLIYHWAENLPESLHRHWHVGCRDSDFLSIELADRMETIKLQVLESGVTQTMEVRFESPSQQVTWYKFSIDCHRSPKGEIIGVITTGVDVSHLRRREQMLKILLREVSHRSKNLLSIIQSIATQTARHTESVQSFLRKFQGRVQSMSNSQDLVTDSDWRGAQFKDLVFSQASNYLTHQIKRFRVGGDNAYLFPGAALHIGLALHELIINSLSYGALGQKYGVVTLTSQIHPLHLNSAEEETGTKLAIHWQEDFDGFSNNFRDNKACFGSVLLEKIVPLAVNGEAHLEFTPRGVCYRLSLPDKHFDIHQSI